MRKLASFLLWCTSQEVPVWLILSKHSYTLAFFIVFGLFLTDATTIPISDTNTCPTKLLFLRISLSIWTWGWKDLKNYSKNIATFLNVHHKKQLTSFFKQKTEIGPTPIISTFNLISAHFCWLFVFLYYCYLLSLSALFKIFERFTTCMLSRLVRFRLVRTFFWTLHAH